MAENGRRIRIPLLLLASLLLTLLTSSLPLARAVNLNLLYVSPSGQAPFPQGASVTYQVKVAGMSAFNDWDIQVQTDPTVLSPVDFSITPNTLTANFSIQELEFAHCVNGAGLGCDPARGDDAGVVHSVVFPLGGAPESASISGVLFTISYVVMRSGASAILIFNDQLANAGTIVLHSTQNGIYGNAQLPHVDFSWTPTEPLLGQPVTFISNSSDPNSGGSIASYVWNFGDLTGSHLGLGANATDTYTAQSGGLPLNTTTGQAFGFIVRLTVTDSLGVSNSITHFLVVHLIRIQPPPDFSIYTFLYTGVPATMSAGSSFNLLIFVDSKNGFTGAVNLSASISPYTTSAPTAVLNPSSPTIAPTKSANSTLTVYTSTTTTPTTYNVTVTSSAGSISHSFSFRLLVNPFSIQTSTDSITLRDGSSGTVLVAVESINGFNGTLNFSAAARCSGCTATLVRTVVTLSPNQTTTIPLRIMVASYTPAFRYPVDVHAVGECSGGVCAGWQLDKEFLLTVPLLEPVFVESGLSWTHRLSLSDNSLVQTWTATVENPNGGELLVTNIHIDGRSQDGSSRFSGDSGPIPLQPGETRLNITITHVFNASDIGQTFTFKATIQWGFNPYTLTLVSSSTKTGSFMVD